MEGRYRRRGDVMHYPALDAGFLRSIAAGYSQTRWAAPQGYCMAENGN